MPKESDRVGGTEGGGGPRGGYHSNSGRRDNERHEKVEQPESRRGGGPRGQGRSYRRGGGVGRGNGGGRFSMDGNQSQADRRESRLPPTPGLAESFATGMALKEDGSFQNNVGPEALALLAQINGEAEAHEELGHVARPVEEVPARRESSEGMVCAVCTEQLDDRIHRPAMGACEHVDTCALCYLRLRRLLGDQVRGGRDGRRKGGREGGREGKR